VKSILCNDAPEGLSSDDADDEAELTTKDVLSYSWRALKESRLVAAVVDSFVGTNCIVS